MKHAQYSNCFSDFMQKNQEFDSLNKMVNSYGITSEKIISAYHNIILNRIEDPKKEEIHWQIQYLIEEKRIPINKILDFANLKDMEQVAQSVSKIIQSALGINCITNAITEVIYANKPSTLVVSNFYFSNNTLIQNYAALKIEEEDNHQIIIKKVQEFINDFHNKFPNQNINDLTIQTFIPH